MLVKVDHYRLFHQALKPDFLLPVQPHGHGGDTAHLTDEVKSARRHIATPFQATNRITLEM